jgi:Ca2+-binding RTX toxin-like protein
MLKQEYLYCLIYANWGMIDSHVDGGSLAPEWSDSHLTSEAIHQDNPLGQQIFSNYISAVISKPSVGIVDRQFKDFGGGIELYTPDGLDMTGKNSSDILKGDNGNDVISGLSGEDTLIGYRGFDSLSGGNGNDELRAGNGRDILTGGAGSDTMYGGFGLNTFKDAADGVMDKLYFKSDQWAENWLYAKAGNSPQGQKSDKITELDSFDRIYIQGVATSQLSYRDVIHQSNLGETLSGIGIYASGYLEAVYVGDDLSMSQIAAMTQGIT